MELQVQNNPAQAQTAQIIQQLLTAFAGQRKLITSYFDKYDDAVYQQQVAPGRNRAIYLLGHLIANHDNLLPILGIGEKLYPELEEVFLINPDKTFPVIPGIPELRTMWTELNDRLDAGFAEMTTDRWLDRHTRVSEADFAKERHRNKLNVLIGRTVHVGYHLGQLNLLKTV